MSHFHLPDDATEEELTELAMVARELAKDARDPDRYAIRYTPLKSEAALADLKKVLLARAPEPGPS